MPFTGIGAIWYQDIGQFVLTNAPGDAGGLATAKGIAGGLVNMGPGTEALAIGTSGWVNKALCLVDSNGNYRISRFMIADGNDPTKLLRWDASAITTGLTRVATIPNWSGVLILPADQGVAGRFLRSNAPGQATWEVVSVTNNLLDGANHLDTVAQAVARGALVVGNSTPKWDRLTIGAANTVLTSNGTDPAWSSNPALDHSSLSRLIPFSVANCNWTTATPNISTSGGGFASVRVGDFIYAGALAVNGLQGARVLTWTDSNNIVADINNGGATLTNQTLVIQPGDHWNNTLALDTGNGMGLFLTGGRGTYTTGTGGTYQEIRGPVRWMGSGSGAVDTDFDVRGSKSTGTLSGFCIRKQGTTNRAYFYSERLTGSVIYGLPNITGGFDLLLTDGAQDVHDKIFLSNNDLRMEASAGAGNGVKMSDPTNTGKTLRFDLTSIANPADRIARWTDYNGTVAVEATVATISGATPSVAGGRTFKVTNGGATNMTAMTADHDAQEVNLIFTNGNTTLKDTSTTGTFELPGSGDITPAANECFKFVRVNADSKWYCLSRSIN